MKSVYILYENDESCSYPILQVYSSISKFTKSDVFEEICKAKFPSVGIYQEFIDELREPNYFKIYNQHVMSPRGRCCRCYATTAQSEVVCTGVMV